MGQPSPVSLVRVGVGNQFPFIIGSPTGLSGGGALNGSRVEAEDFGRHALEEAYDEPRKRDRGGSLRRSQVPENNCPNQSHGNHDKGISIEEHCWNKHYKFINCEIWKGFLNGQLTN